MANQETRNNDVNVHILPNSVDGTTPRQMDVNALKGMVQNVKPLNWTKLYNPDKLKETLKFMDMANALYHEAESYPDPHDRHINLYKRFELLALFNHGLYKAAFNRKLYEGDYGKLVKAFQDGHGDPKKIYENMKKFQDEKADQMINGIAEFHKNNPTPPGMNQLATNEQERINQIVQSYEASRNQQPPK